jgi:DNA-binding transcriptional regulator YdaS (Cro superfamily)
MPHPIQKQETIDLIRKHSLKVSDVAAIIGVNPARVSDYVLHRPSIKPDVANRIEDAVNKIALVRDYLAPFTITIRDAQSLDLLYEEARGLSQIGPKHLNAALKLARAILETNAGLDSFSSVSEQPVGK